MRSFVLPMFVLFAAGCGPPDPSPPAVATVLFEYRAATARDTRIPDCGVGDTHIHPGWRAFRIVPLHASGASLWSRSFGDVPVTGPVAIRVSDANLCLKDPNGAATDNVYANGVKLTRIVPTPGGGGDEPGFQFSVAQDGTVTP